MVKNKNKIAYVVPCLSISGGIAIILQHANHLKNRGYDVVLVNCGDSVNKISWFDNAVPIVNVKDDKSTIKEEFDIAIATYFGTIDFVSKLNSKRKIYFVQSDERRFNPENTEDFTSCDNSYRRSFEFMTEAKWIQRWLKEEFGKDAYYVPNGLDDEMMHEVENLKTSKKRPRILLEGPIDTPFKGMEDSYNAIKGLDCEVWIVSSGGKPKPGWRCDKFFEKVPFEEMKNIYSACDIFLKMSRVEGFFGPPMEAMACGCSVVVGKVTGYDEYIKNGYNALVVNQRDVKGARNAVKKLIGDKKLRNDLIENGHKTAEEWSWNKSIDLLEKVIAKEAVEIFYTENVPERYDYDKVIKDLLLDTIERLRDERDFQITRSNEYENEIKLMRQSIFWKLRGLYLKFKFLAFSPHKFIRKYFARIFS
jgi:O-antigen biosynthesis protein